jgi:hypothetical protein
MRRLTPIGMLLLAGVLGGCGDDDGSTTTVNQTTTVTQQSPMPTTESETTTGPEPTTETQPGRQGCTDAAGNAIQIIAGDLGCTQAQATAAQYDAQGARVQEVGSFTCEGGNATTRPVIFTCTGSDGEFVVREAGG